MVRLTLGLLGGVLALCACGGDDPKPATPEEQVRAAAKRVVESQDAKAVCTTLVTKRFIDEVYEGDRAACIKTPLTKEDEKTGKAEIGRVTIDGSQADVEITQVGGDADGTKGTLMFAREGGRWKLDRFGEDYLRSALVASIEVVDAGVASLPAMKRCLIPRMRHLPEPKLRRLLYQSIREDPQAGKTVLAVAEKNCPKALAAFVGIELVDALAEKGGLSSKKPAYIRCMKSQVAFFAEVTGLASSALKNDKGGFGAAGLAGIVSGADKNCADKK